MGQSASAQIDFGFGVEEAEEMAVRRAGGVKSQRYKRKKKKTKKTVIKSRNPILTDFCQTLK